MQILLYIYVLLHQIHTNFSFSFPTFLVADFSRNNEMRSYRSWILKRYRVLSHSCYACRLRHPPFHDNNRVTTHSTSFGAFWKITFWNNMTIYSIKFAKRYGYTIIHKYTNGDFKVFYTHVFIYQYIRGIMYRNYFDFSIHWLLLLITFFIYWLIQPCFPKHNI